MIKLKKPKGEEILVICMIIIALLVSTRLITGCTNTLIKIRGEGNKVHQEQKTETKVDSVTTKIDIKK